MFSDCSRGSKRFNHNDIDSDNFITMKIYNTGVLVYIGASSYIAILYRKKKVGMYPSNGCRFKIAEYLSMGGLERTS